jgi:hypothetical protein
MTYMLQLVFGGVGGVGGEGGDFFFCLEKCDFDTYKGFL